MAVGPSTTQTPYIVGSEPNVRFTSILSAGESVGARPDGVAYRMPGIPDGLGAFDNGNGTFTLLMNHELGATTGIVREHGSIGAFVSELVIDRSTLRVISAGDLAKDVFLYNPATGGFGAETTTTFGRLCSADLASVSAFFDAASGLGTRERIFLTGEEVGAEGRLFGMVATGAEKGDAFELAYTGKFSWENALAAPGAGAKTVVVGLDDATPGQVYIYVGDKQAAGNAVEKAGLTNGQLFGVKVDGVRTETTNTAFSGDQARFTLEALGNAASRTGAQLETQSDTQGVTEFFRPEDGQWDTQNPNHFYFVTTASFTENSRLYRLEFADVTNPAAGGTIRMLLRGDEGHRMLDNMTVTSDGRVIMQEDVGNNPRLGKVWDYDPRTDVLRELAQHDPARFLGPTPPFSQDEESSGVIDVTGMLGNADTQAFLLNVQAHAPFGATGSADRTEIVEQGQLLAMFVDRPRDGGAGNDAVNGGFGDDRLNGQGGDDVILGGGGADVLGGGTGRDFILGGAGDDVVGGEADDDRINGEAGRDALFGDAGNDLIGGGDGDDLIFGQAGDDFIGGEAGADRINGGDGSDKLFGDAGADLIGGGAGDDGLFGQDGDDFMGGEDGDDFLDGGAGIDVLFGDAGNDTLLGGGDNDRLFGQNGTDNLFGGAGDDFLDGGAGVDTAFFSGARSAYTITTDGAFTTITGVDGTDRLLQVERLQFGDQSVSLSSPLPEDGSAQILPAGHEFVI